MTVEKKEAAKRIEELMKKLKMNESTSTHNEYQHGVIDGLGNALAILLDDEGKEDTAPLKTKGLSNRIIPWENWWDTSTVENAS